MNEKQRGTWYSKTNRGTAWNKALTHGLVPGGRNMLRSDVTSLFKNISKVWQVAKLEAESKESRAQRVERLWFATKSKAPSAAA